MSDLSLFGRTWHRLHEGSPTHLALRAPSRCAKLHADAIPYGTDGFHPAQASGPCPINMAGTVPTAMFVGVERASTRAV